MPSPTLWTLLQAPWRCQPAIAGWMDRRLAFAFGRVRVTISALCGRFTQNLSWAEIHRLADLIGQPRNLAPRFNIAPTTPIEVIRASDAGNELVPMYWGLVPSWWKKPLKELPATFNARAETLAERPMFLGAFKYRRCIIPASGFYEGTGGKGPRRRTISRRAKAVRSRSRVYGTIGAGSMAATTFRTRRSSSGRRMVGCGAFTTECRLFSIGATRAAG
jgi:putative SOS response-associated peptidase YedK